MMEDVYFLTDYRKNDVELNAELKLPNRQTCSTVFEVTVWFSVTF